ncbi:hypothetical protein NP233_g5151 [Leucocoprinus birnbaumii]|uniref:AP-1 complex subunit sigma-1 n=1 Tax=Leucocoprinus birnbaumii TaxID=56174 RepID=A0AAD5VUT0_9AGAR|nr:hypothetical protein NP233_g5151 [Leucocoprinus birnbaumii]
MTSLGLVFDPSDLDHGHISNVILRTVQASLTPRIQSGRGDAMLVPKFSQRYYRNSIPWLRFTLEVRGSYPGKVPPSVMAIIFPKGAKAREHLLEKTNLVRNVLDWAAPKIYGTSLESDPKSYTAVIMEDVEYVGAQLDKVWSLMSNDQKKAVLDKLADILCVPLHIRPDAGMQQQAPSSRGPAAASSSAVTLPSGESSKSPLSSSNYAHLRKGYAVLYKGLFRPNGEPDILAFRQRFKEYETYELSPQETARIKSLNALLQEHMSEFSGGNFLPPHITGRNKESFKGQKERDKFTERKLVLEAILSESLFRLAHKQMFMSSFFVLFEADGTTVKSVVLTQWEKAYYSPLWAACQLPNWLEPLDPELVELPMPEEEMTQWREYLVYNLMMKKERLARSWLWFVAYTYGELERHFEMILTTTWVFSAKTEPWLRRVLEEARKKHTMAYKKGVDPGPFVPLAGKIQTMDVNFAEMMGKWMPYARAFVVEEGLLKLPISSSSSTQQLGKVRLTKWYATLPSKTKNTIIRDITTLVLSRRPKMCNVLEYKGRKVVYKRYASLFFIAEIDAADNELTALEILHRYVEVLDRVFGNVCELDLIFNFEMAYFVLDELLLGGEMQETSKSGLVLTVQRVKMVEAEDSIKEDLVASGMA